MDTELPIANMAKANEPKVDEYDTDDVYSLFPAE